MQLIDAIADQHIWADEYNRDWSTAQLVEVQSDVARQIAEAASVTILPTEALSIGDVPTANAEAYEFYLRGVAAIRGRFQTSDNERSIGLLERAIALDPGFALAKAALANAKITLFADGAGHEALMLEAKQILDEVLNQHPELPLAHYVLGNYHYRRREYALALAAWSRDVEFGGGGDEINGLVAAVYRRQGRFEEALTYRRRQAELDPLSANNQVNLALTYLYLRRFEEAGAAPGAPGFPGAAGEVRGRRGALGGQDSFSPSVPSVHLIRPTADSS